MTRPRVYIDRVLKLGHVRFWFRAQADSGGIDDTPRIERIGTHCVGLPNWFDEDLLECRTKRAERDALRSKLYLNIEQKPAVLLPTGKLAQAEMDDYFTGHENWTNFFKMEFRAEDWRFDWGSILELGVCPGQAFCMELKGTYREWRDWESGGVEANFELNVGEVIEREPLSEKKAAARIESLFKRAGLHVPYVDLSLSTRIAYDAVMSYSVLQAKEMRKP